MKLLAFLILKIRCYIYLCKFIEKKHQIKDLFKSNLITVLQVSNNKQKNVIISTY